MFDGRSRVDYNGCRWKKVENSGFKQITKRACSSANLIIQLMIRGGCQYRPNFGLI
jgi:hypothetical protein